MQRFARREDGRQLPLLVWRFDAPARVIASAPLGGGLGTRRWVLNAQVASDYTRLDPEGHLQELRAALGLPVDDGVGMLTAADVLKVQTANDGGVVAAATVGLGQPTWASARGEAGRCDTAGEDATPTAGTINIVVHVPTALTDAALVNAVATATEAKTQALFECGVDATGTATDAVCISCPTGGRPAPFGGPRSRWGSPLARAVHQAVLAGTRAWIDAR